METFIKVNVGSSQMKLVSVKSGLRQGDSTSLVLFIVVLKKVIKAMNIGPNEGVKLHDSSLVVSLGLLVTRTI
jgi:hypothetical protein